MTTDFKNIHSAYTLVSSEYIDEVKSQAAMFKHNKTGACVAVLSNEDKNKVFDIIFRTTPKDSTGVAHILEQFCAVRIKAFPGKRSICGVGQRFPKHFPKCYDLP